MMDLCERFGLGGSANLSNGPFGDCSNAVVLWSPLMSHTKSKASETRENRRSRFAEYHSRTYEMELLVSGAVVFGLIHLPPVIARVFDSFRAGLEGNVRLIGVFGQIYLQLVLYALIAIFVLHLVIRGFWIGLLGLESVFPQGIQWNRTKLGPLSLRRYRVGIGSLAQSIEKVDDLCSLVFSFGFLVVFIWIYFVLVLMVSALVGIGLSWLFFGGNSSALVFWIVGFSIIIGQPLTEIIDRTFGGRVRSGGILERVLQSMVNISFSISPIRLIGSTQLTLATNTSNMRVSVILVVCMVALAGVQIGGLVLGQGIVRIDSLVYFPDNLRDHGMDPRHYRSKRGPRVVEPGIPSIQSDLVADPYLKLLIPYNPRRHNHLVAEVCPDLKPLSKNGLDGGRGKKLKAEHVQMAAECLGSLFEISIDGHTPPDIHFDFTIEYGTGLEGIITFLPLDTLGPGRHELLILTPPKPGPRAEDTPPPEPVRHLIPFWI